MNINEIKRYIKDNRLAGSSRIRGRVYRRAYICAYLRSNTDMSLEEIGRLLNRDHSSVIHYIRNIHTAYEDLKDKEYYNSTKTLRDKCPIENSLPIVKVQSKGRVIKVDLDEDEVKRLKMYMADYDLKYFDKAIKHLVGGVEYAKL